MALIARRLLSLKLTLVLSTALLAGLLIRVSFTEAEVVPCSPPSTITIFQTPTEDHACGVVDEEGGKVQTESPATSDNPHWTRVVIPPGFPGTVTIDETDERVVGRDVSAANGPTCDPNRPYTCLVSFIETTQTTNRRNPMVFRFTYDKSTIPAGTNLQRVRIYHDERRVPRCDVDPDEGAELEQGQRSCHLTTKRLANRDVRIVVLSTINGSWRPR